MKSAILELRNAQKMFNFASFSFAQSKISLLWQGGKLIQIPFISDPSKQVKI